MIQITFSKLNNLRLLPTLFGKGDVDFVKLAQNRHHKKTVIPLCRRLKRLFSKQRRHLFEIRTTKLKVKPVESGALWVQRSVKQSQKSPKNQHQTQIVSLHNKAVSACNVAQRTFANPCARTRGHGCECRVV
jgi:hypothetical protein